MRVNRLTLLCLTVLVAVAKPAGAFAADPGKQEAPVLTDADKKLLDRLLAEFVFDPKGADYVAAKATARTVWAQAVEYRRKGWYVLGREKQPGRVYFVDAIGAAVGLNEKPAKIDVIAECRERYKPSPPTANTEDDFSVMKARMQRAAIGDFGAPDLVVSAWLYRLGEEKLAAGALSRARQVPAGEKADDASMVADLKRQLATSAYLAIVHAYMVRADDEALANGQRLFKFYPEQAKKLNQSDEIVADLERRQKKGTFGKEPPMKWPDHFDSWDVPKKLDYLVESLDEIDARQWSQPGGVPLGMDRRVEALIKIGEPAVPKLIDTVEHDDRLTRAVQFNRDFRLDRTVVPVRQAALHAVISIFGVRSLDPTEEESFPYVYDKKKVKKVVEQLRAYWKKNGGVPPDERMMRVLVDLKASDEACREAAHNLTSWGNSYVPGPLELEIRPSDNPRPNPDPRNAKFKNPSAAEAILAALDRHLAAHDAKAKPEAGLPDFERHGIEKAYLESLVELRDQRMADEFVRRYKRAPTLHLRLAWAVAANASGAPEPVKELAHEFQQGTVAISGNDLGDGIRTGETGTTDLRDIVNCLVRIDLPETNRALFALADPKQPLHDRVARKIAEIQSGRFHHGEAYLEHPFCLAMLGSQLSDQTPTGGTYRIERNQLDYRGPNLLSGSSLPDFLRDPAARHETATEQVCDSAAVKIGELVFGMPLVHPLRLDRDERLREMKALMDRYQGRFRRIQPAEGQVTGWEASFVADIRPLGRPATADDVKTGRAIFSLFGSSKLSPLKLPASASVKQTKGATTPEKVLVVQAELDGEKTIYGVIGRHAMRSANADELTDLKPIAPAPR